MQYVVDTTRKLRVLICQTLLETTKMFAIRANKCSGTIGQRHHSAVVKTVFGFVINEDRRRLITKMVERFKGLGKVTASRSGIERGDRVLHQSVVE